MAKRVWELLYEKDLKDGRHITKSILSDLILTTSKKHSYPLSFGHEAASGWWDDSIQSAGKVSNLRLDKEGVLIADIEMSSEVEKDFKDHKYAGWSAGISRKTVVKQDVIQKEPWELGHVALLGSTEAAFKDLQDITAAMEFSENPTITNIKETDNCFSFVRGDREYLRFSAMGKEVKKKEPNNNETEAFKMDPNEIERLKTENIRLMNEHQKRELEAIELKEKIEKLKKEKKEAAIKVFSEKKNELEAKLLEFGITEETKVKVFNANEKSVDLFEAKEEIDNSIAEAFMALFSEVKKKVDPGPSTKKGKDEDSEDEAILTPEDMNK